MKRFSWSTGLAVAAACGMILSPAVPVLAAAPAAATAPATQAAVPHFKLDANNTLPGVVVDLAGQPLAGTLVHLHRDGATTGKAVTGEDGTFRLVVPVGSAQGEYRLSVGTQTIPCHVWNEATAPPTARTKAALAAGTPGPQVRGQEYCPPGPGQVVGGPAYGPPMAGGGVPGVLGLDFVTLFTLGAAGTAAVLSGINQSDINDIEDTLDAALSP